MSIRLYRYDFEGPFEDKSGLKNQSGVYAILGWDSVNKEWQVVDIGESKEVKDRVEDHERENCWKAQDYKILGYAAYYCTKNVRDLIEPALRLHFDPPCGDR